jgi:putative aminopeptidase FrvX
MIPVMEVEMPNKPKKTAGKRPAQRDTKPNVNLLKMLVEAHGPSGCETRVRAIIEKELKPHVDEMSVDKLGNLIAHKKGEGPKVMIAVHMDEIGLMVKDINKRGHIRFATIGGIEPITLVGQTVRIYKKNNTMACTGVITFAELHEDHQIEEMPALDELYIDTGLTRDRLGKLGIGVGCYVVARHHFKRLGSTSIISGKALDDRIGCYVLIEVARKLKKADLDIYYVFTTQEEIGLYGAQVSAYKLNPDWGLAIDTINAEDTGEFETKGVEMGKGPALLLMDAEAITNRALNDWIIDTARKAKIPLQLRVEEEGTTDATAILLSKGGIPASTITVPIRNLHSTVGVAHMKDINDMIKLLTRLLKSPPKLT